MSTPVIALPDFGLHAPHAGLERRAMLLEQDAVGVLAWTACTMRP